MRCDQPPLDLAIFGAIYVQQSNNMSVWKLTNVAVL